MTFSPGLFRSAGLVRRAAALGMALLLALSGAAASAQTSIDAKSPSGVLGVELSTEGGVARYQVNRFGAAVLSPSQLGFLLRDEGKLERGMKIVAHSTSTHDETWEQPWGESRFVRNRYTELRATLAEQIKTRRSYDIVFRIYDDGIGFRYEFPNQSQLPETAIQEELTEFILAPPGTAWWIPAGEWNRYEYPYNKSAIAEVGTAHTPITFRTDDGLHIAFHEAALVDYASMWLRRVEGQRFRAQLAPSAQGWKVVRAGAFNTPWRTIQIADSAAALYMSANLILNLNEPNRLGDMSWFTPHKYVGIWWAMHLGDATWESGPKHGATTQNAKRHIDFAARNGFRGVLIEGWNAGWDGNWIGNSGRTFDFVKPYPDFDLEEVARYARSKGVRLIGHHETAGNAGRYEAQLGPALDNYARLGVDSIKTGYVADAGGILRKGPNGEGVWEWHDGQFMTRHHLKVVEEAAKRRIAINPHEPVKDTGLRRTYPNWVSREGARGMEYSAWGSPPNKPDHEANLVFTRMLSGPMDYTPGILSLQGKQGNRVASTLAKQLALYVVIYSPIQMVADLPENYERHPGAFQFIKDVPTDWAETRVLNGEVGDFVTFARRDRNSGDWYLGSVTDENGRHLQIPLSFLDRKRSYRAEIYRDGPGADWSAAPFDIVIEKKLVTSADVLDLRLAAGGGAAIRFVPTR